MAECRQGSGLAARAPCWAPANLCGLDLGSGKHYQSHSSDLIISGAWILKWENVGIETISPF